MHGNVVLCLATLFLVFEAISSTNNTTTIPTTSTTNTPSLSTPSSSLTPTISPSSANESTSPNSSIQPCSTVQSCSTYSATVNVSGNATPTVVSSLCRMVTVSCLDDKSASLTSTTPTTTTTTTLNATTPPTTTLKPTVITTPTTTTTKTPTTTTKPTATTTSNFTTTSSLIITTNATISPSPSGTVSVSSTSAALTTSAAPKTIAPTTPSSKKIWDKVIMEYLGGTLISFIVMVAAVGLCLILLIALICTCHRYRKLKKKTMFPKDLIIGNDSEWAHGHDNILMWERNLRATEVNPGSAPNYPANEKRL